MRGRHWPTWVLLALAGALSSCSRHAPFTVSKPLGPPPARAPGPVLLRVLHFGDFGYPTSQHKAMAAAMIAAHQRARFDLVWSVGDNVYDCGADATLSGADRCSFAADDNTVDPTYQPPVDPVFADHFERSLEPLAQGERAAPFYLVLGNHDVNAAGSCSSSKWASSEALARDRACLQVAHHSPEWTMPARHFVLDRGPVRFIAIDSNLFTGDYGGFKIQDEIDFVRSAVAGCSGHLCFIVAHHPPVTAGSHLSDATPDYLSRVALIDEAASGRVAAWLTGHDHDLQHLRAAAGYDVIVSGNTARGRASERFATLSAPGSELLYASTGWGYGVLEVSADGWSYRFEDEKGQAVHCCQALAGGHCEPVACNGH